MKPTSELAQDFRYAARQLRRTPGFTVVAVLTLALGVGAHTAFFSIVNAIALKPIPVARLDGVYSVDGGSGVSLAGLRALERDLPAGASAVAAMDLSPSQVLMHASGRAEERLVEAVSGGFAATLDLRPQHGRWISADDDRGDSPERVVVISDRLWREWFAADPAAVGRASLSIRRTPFRIVGVAPRGLTGLQSRTGRHTDAWVSLTDWWTAWQVGPGHWEAMALTVFVRARTSDPPVDLQGSVQARLSSQPGPKVVNRLGQTKIEEGVNYVLVHASEALGNTETTRLAMILMAFSGLVLLAASANLANMLYARNSARTGEMAVRLSLGAGRWRAMRLLLVEAGLIGGGASALGVAIGLTGLSIFGALFPTLELSYERRVFTFDADGLVVLSGLAVGVVAASLVGLVAAWRVTRLQSLTELASSSGASTASPVRGRRTRTALVAVQVTAAVLLVMSAGLFVEKVRVQLTRRLHVHFNASPLAAARVNMNLHDYSESQGRVFFERLIGEARALKGVERAALADGVPGSKTSGFARTVITAEGRPEGPSGEPPRIYAGFMRISPGFFDTVGTGLRTGRDFGPGDAVGAPLVAILSVSAADALWPGQDPIGKRLTFEGRPLTIVGVAPNLVSGLSGAREEFPGSERFPATRPSNSVYVPFAQHYRANMFVVVRSRDRGQADALRATIRGINDNVAVLEAASVSSMLSWLDALWAAAGVMLTLAAVALGIAMLGVYGVVAFFVSTRTREFGIRLALGATPRTLMKLVFDYSFHVIIVGLLPAVFIAAVGSRLIESRQLDLMPNEISTWVIVPLLLVAAGVVAGFVPARRAAQTNPTVSLRQL